MISKLTAEYTHKYAGKEKCEACDMFRKPRACSLVIGVINSEGRCKYWEAKKRLPVSSLTT